MKRKSTVVIAVLAATMNVRSQTVEADGGIDPQVAPVVSTARIIGNIPDGTPPPPAPPKAEFVVPAKDILATTTHEQGGRTITIQRIKPIDLPPPPESVAQRSAALSEDFAERMAKYRAEHPRVEMITLGATVYRSKNSPPRTLVRYWPGNGAGTISFWSSADFALLSGIHSFAGTDGKPRTLFMTWSSIDTDRMASLIATRRVPSQVPDIPTLPEGKATFQILGEAPAADLLIPVQSLHDLYNTEHDRLLTAYEGREQARLAQEAQLKAHPPVPQDITIQYWRTESPAPVKGGSK